MACTNVMHDAVDCRTAGLRIEDWCEPCVYDTKICGFRWRERDRDGAGLMVWRTCVLDAGHTTIPHESELLYRVEVVADDSGIWCSNGMRFSSKAAATEHARDLARRWTLVRAARVVRLYVPERETDDGTEDDDRIVVRY